MRQYEVWWAELPAPIGRRPVLLLSRDSAYEYLHRILVAEITTRVRNIPVEVRLGAHEGLAKACVANLDNIHTIARALLSARLGSLRRGRVAEVKRALGYVLDWRELKDL